MAYIYIVTNRAALNWRVDKKILEYIIYNTQHDDCLIINKTPTLNIFKETKHKNKFGKFKKCVYTFTNLPLFMALFIEMWK